MAKKVLFINQEISPYVPESELSIMGRDLPNKMQEAGYEIRTFMPKWGNINELCQLHEIEILLIRCEKLVVYFAERKASLEILSNRVFELL